MMDEPQTILERIEAARQAREEADRTFQLAGETFKFRKAVAPEVVFRFRSSQRMSFEDQKTEWEWAAKLRAAQDMNGGGEEAIARLIVERPEPRQTDEELLATADATIIGMLEPESHEAWARLRSEDNPHPLTYDECFDVLHYLIGAVAEIPTGAPSGSSPGRTQTEKPSKAASSSTAKTSKRST